MKRWIVIVAVLICCGVYAMVKLSISQYQDANTREEETPGAKQTEADNTDKATREKDSSSPATAAQTDKATPEEDFGSPASAAQIEAVTKAFGDFQSALESKDYEQAWKLTSESFKSQGSFEEFKEIMADVGAVVAKATIRPESATNIDGRVRVLVTDPSDGDDHVSFVQEDGQWKLDP